MVEDEASTRTGPIERSRGIQFSSSSDLSRQERLPDGPDPGPEITRFLGFVKRNNAAVSVRICRKKVGQSLNIEAAIKSLRPRVEIRWSPKTGEQVVWTRDTDWVDAWARVHGVDIPHHASRLRQLRKEKILL